MVEGTRITLNDKETIPIENIKVGEEILSFNLNTLQKSQKYDNLLKMKTNSFNGVFNEDLVKSVWKNTADEYYLINNKLKITKDHIVMAKRDITYYWTIVENLLLNDYLFTELNIFERIFSIEIIKEKVKVFNLEVNRVFNYFANSYLIHNGSPCLTCLGCGTLTSLDFVFAPQKIASYGYLSDTTNNWTSIRNSSETLQVINGNTWSDSTDQNTFGSLPDLITKIESDSGDNKEDWKYSRKVYLFGTDPQYSARGALPIFNTDDDVEFYVKIKRVGNNGFSNGVGNPNYNLWGIGIMRKFNSFVDGYSPKNVNTTQTSETDRWITDNNDAAPYALQPQESNINSLIFQNNNIMIRLLGDTNLYSKDIEVPFYGRLNAAVSGSSSGIEIKDFHGRSGDISSILTDYKIIGANGDIHIPINVTGATYNSNIYTISTASNITGDENQYVGFTKLPGDFTSKLGGNRGQPSGMGYNYNKSYGTTTGGESPSEGNFGYASRAGGSGSTDFIGNPVKSSKINYTDVDAIINVGGIIGFEITSNASVETNRLSGDSIRLITFYGKAPAGTKTMLLEKELPELYFDKDNKLYPISNFNSSSTVDGAWAPLVFDSTSDGTTSRDITLEIVNSI